MKKGDVLKVGDMVRIRAGKRAGLVGECIGLDSAGALVEVKGVQNGEPVDFVERFTLGNLGRNDG